VIAGGGVGGVAAARFLSGELAKHGVEAEVTLVSDRPVHYMPPLFFDVAMGEASPEETRAPLDALERRFGVRVLVDPLAGIEAGENMVRLASGRTLEYDYLIVALGTTMEWSKYPGLAEAGHHNYSEEGAVRLREELSRFRGGDVVILVPETPYRCGIYPFEVATVLGATFRRRGIEASVKILSADPKPVTPLGPDIHGMWYEAFEELGVEFVHHKGLEEVDPERRVVRASNVEERFDLLIKVPPPGLPEPLRASEGFTLESDPRWAPVRGAEFRHPKFDNVFMVGEHSMAPAGLSLAGVFVHNAAFVASNAIAAEVVGYYPGYSYPTATCAGYLGDRAFLGHCEPRYNRELGKYEWGGRCYLGMVSSLARFLKFGFYKSWLDTLK